MSVLLFGAPTRALCSLFKRLIPLMLFFYPAVANQLAVQDKGLATWSIFRVERKPITGGAELITIIARMNETNGVVTEIPMVSVLRDSLGDSDPTNDKLRYVWMLTYTNPSFKQRVAAAIPFFYTRVGNKHNFGNAPPPPPPVLDLARTDKRMWENLLWTVVQNLFLDSTEVAFKASANHYRRSVDDYRKVHTVRALAILSLYEAETGTSPVFTPTEIQDIQARLTLTEKTLGGIVDDIYLQRVYQKSISSVSEIRGQNWELLRQRTEAEGLYFEPLEQPDGSATHALIWVAEQDIKLNKDRKFNSRFLNIKSPWNDKQLIKWRGYKETRYFDGDNRLVPAETPGARAAQMIPLAVYGLDYPKIPALLVDFRDNINPKKREVSRRLLDDIARNILAVSKFGDLHFFLGRTLLDFITERRGIDLNQPSRIRVYSQLKLLLSLNESLNPELRQQITRRLEHVSINPMENDIRSESKLAHDQYRALLNYATNPEGLPKLLKDDRGEELVPLVHGKAERILFRLGNILSFGLYTHREDLSTELLTQMERRRKLAYHTRFLREIGKRSPRVEIVWRIEDIRRSLEFILKEQQGSDSMLAQAAAQIFISTEDEETRRLCLSCLSRMKTETARNELLRIYRDQHTSDSWRINIAKAIHATYNGEDTSDELSKEAIITLVGQ
jgi:hypothetical protein